MSKKMKKSFVAFIDVLGFSERFSKEKDLCIELLSELASYNGEYFDINDSQKQQIRATTFACSDSIVISIPSEFPVNHSDDYCRPLYAFLYAISFFAHKALQNNFLIRGAIAYGDVLHNNLIIAGEPFIETVKHEKIANYPRIILAPSAIDEIKTWQNEHFYGWINPREKFHFTLDNIDNCLYFDWIGFLMHPPFEQSPSNKNFRAETIRTINNFIKEQISKEKNLSILQKFNWMKKYLDKNLNVDLTKEHTDLKV